MIASGLVQELYRYLGVISSRKYAVSLPGDFRTQYPTSYDPRQDEKDLSSSTLKSKASGKGTNPNPTTQPMHSKEETNTMHRFTTVSYWLIFYASLIPHVYRAQVVIVGYFISW